jgi:hypothetical protein
MKNLINKATSLVSGAVLFAFGVVMAGLGLATLGVLGLFALSTVGVALLASPFVTLTQTRDPKASSRSTPKYLTVPSTLVWPRRS